MLKTLGVCSWSLSPNGCSDLIGSVQKCGLSSIQIALDPIASGEWELDAVIDSLGSAKISICSGMMTTIGEDYSSLESIKQTGGIRPDEHWESNLQRARTNAKTAHQLGLRLVTFHAGFIPDDDSSERDTIIDRIQAVGDMFGEYEIKVALETGQEHAQTLLNLLADPRLDTIGINFDPANMILYGMDDPAIAIELLKEKIVQVHMKDAIQTEQPGTWGSEVPVGQGSVDWEHFFRTLQSLPNEINVLIERESGDQRIKDIIEASKVALKHGYPQ